ncbi:MAG: hypothetical protein KKC85_19980 [Gammaproteobacteria bacterium]|nr:hypothetical protein [Gammaproteobacteria bacterium]MBU1440900.1 hypothetical protein [Gammaproteobacteria bacterium]MBU2288688.1 hypothetical protein [Gammaproteobacteria bacterium]
MTALWPWLAVAGLGALHGLNPATGWAWAVACGWRAGHRDRALKALVPIALGHAASVALVAGAVAIAPSMDGAILPALQVLAGALLLVVAAVHLKSHAASRTRLPPAGAGLALGAFITATAHGAGLMLVPALIPLCIGGAAAREITASGSLPLALAAVGVHMAAMLAVTGALASGICHGLEAWRGPKRRDRSECPV